MTISKFLYGANPVYVEWVDSMSTSGWRSKGDYASLKCITIGNLIEKRKDRIVICQSISQYSFGELLEIPLVAIKKIKRLKI